uniref:Hexosyltransferase n=1 Tax=Callorhinchus milii TaxID=7868 RepID=A0A4W3KGF0_CALMI
MLPSSDFLDMYYNLTIKTLMGMNWVATYCPHASYVMKTDSDMFVNTEYLISKLLKPKQPPHHSYFTGYLMRGYSLNLNKDSKWYMPLELYPNERYPVFCSATGYVFSTDLAEKIFHISVSIRRLHLEDVYVGVCLAKLRIDPVPPPNEFLLNH